MEPKKILYNKQTRTLDYFLNQTRNPSMLLRYSKHFILNVATSQEFFSYNVVNDVELLFPDFLDKILKVFEFYSGRNKSDIPATFETFRSNKRQKMLFERGDTKVKKLGMHYFGIATDIVNFKNGRIKWNLNYDDLLLGARQVGLYDLSPYELCHLQFIPTNKQDDWRDFVFNLVRIIQDLLNCKVDGILGGITQGAILFDYERLQDYFKSLESKIKY